MHAHGPLKTTCCILRVAAIELHVVELVHLGQWQKRRNVFINDGGDFQGQMHGDTHTVNKSDLGL